MGNMLIMLGIGILILGVLFNILPKGQLPLLPGDIFIQKEHVSFYFPIVSSILISIILTILVNIFR